MRDDVGAWTERVRRIEDLGYDVLSVSDHLIQGWSMDVFVTLSAAAVVTDRIRLATLVLANDYRHPALVHRAISALDVVSAGRAELGIGTGWLAAEYRALGLTMEPPPTRIARLEEAVRIIRALYAETPLDFQGQHYRIDGLVGLPRPVQVPGPPILIGGGAQPILELAGRHADVAGFLPRRGEDGRIPATELSMTALRRRIDHVERGTQAAGRRPGEVRRQLGIIAWHLEGGAGPARRGWSSLGSAALLAAGADGSLPGVLVGSVETAAEHLIRWRETFGVTDIHIGSDVEAFAGVVARLGRA
ncbi:MAG: TIGR03621 family F420-dependent LLM class oxidoreductase [Candidatus Limnocylindrales bacterium]